MSKKSLVALSFLALKSSQRQLTQVEVLTMPTTFLRHKHKRQRRGSFVVLSAFMTTIFVAALSFSIDYGVLTKERTDLQRAADAAALAGVLELARSGSTVQDLGAARNVVRAYVASNIGSPFNVADVDIEIGRFDPSQIYSNLVLLDTGVFDAIRVTLRRDGTNNPRVPLAFAPILGMQSVSVTVTAAAVLQKATQIAPGANVLPFSVPLDTWNSLPDDGEWIVYGDGKLADESGNAIPGNWGTVDIGAEGNSTSDLSNQMLDGLTQDDLNDMYNDGRISTTTEIDASQSIWLNGDTGLSSGMKDAVQAIHGLTRIVPIYDSVQGVPVVGNNIEYHVVGWGVVTVVGSTWGGSTSVTLSKSFTYDGSLRPHPNLGATSSVINGAFTSPVLVD